ERRRHEDSHQQAQHLGHAGEEAEERGEGRRVAPVGLHAREEREIDEVLREHAEEGQREEEEWIAIGEEGADARRLRPADDGPRARRALAERRGRRMGTRSRSDPAFPAADTHSRFGTPNGATKKGTANEPTIRATTSPVPTRPKSRLAWRTSKSRVATAQYSRSVRIESTRYQTSSANTSPAVSPPISPSRKRTIERRSVATVPDISRVTATRRCTAAKAAPVAVLTAAAAM